MYETEKREMNVRRLKCVDEELGNIDFKPTVHLRPEILREKLEYKPILSHWLPRDHTS